MKKNVFAQLIGYLGEHKPKMICSIILAILGEIIGILPFLSIAYLVTQVLYNLLTIHNAILAFCLALLSYLLKMLLTGKSSLLSHYSSFAILKNIRITLTDKLMNIPMGVILKTPLGTFKNLIVDQVSKLEDSLAHFMPEIISNIIAPICSIALIFIVDWRMGFASLITIPVALLFYLGIMIGHKEKMNAYMSSLQALNSNLVEYVNGIKVIKAFCSTDSSFAKFEQSVIDYSKSTLAWWRQCWFFTAASKAIVPSTLLGVLPIGAYLYMNNNLTIGAFVIAIVVPMSFIAPLFKLSGASEEFAMIGASLTVIDKFLSIKELSRPREYVTIKKPEFIFKNVSFAYEEKIVINNLSFETPIHSMTAIVGPSGSGKSTIAKLMAGFWDIQDGEIIFGGVNLKDIPQNQLGDYISYVAQDNFLFDKSIRENILFGKPNATESEIINACKSAGCHDFISTMPKGYDTNAGEAGSSISGGERQRITLARAFLKDSPVIILDEATAYADPENEHIIQNAINKLVHGKTVIIIAHKLSTIVNAQKIIVMNDGRISDAGTHTELLQRCSLYKKLWDLHMISIDKGES